MRKRFWLWKGRQRSRGQISLKTRLRDNPVEVEVADNGHGIPIDVQSRIFEPFFTTKEEGEGTGIGLAFSHRIVESHDGTLTLRSAPGQGTQFFVTLARAQTTGQEKQPRLVVQQTVQTALVVDDKQGVARLISDMLTEEGFQVTTDTNPRAALHIADKQEFDVILSDFKMPEMTGDVFYRALRAISPRNAERIGFITGDALSSDVSGFLAASQGPHIEKPILKPELLELIARTTGKV